MPVGAARRCHLGFVVVSRGVAYVGGATSGMRHLASRVDASWGSGLGWRRALVSATWRRPSMPFGIAGSVGCLDRWTPLGVARRCHLEFLGVSLGGGLRQSGWLREGAIWRGSCVPFGIASSLAARIGERHLALRVDAIWSSLAIRVAAGTFGNAAWGMRHLARRVDAIGIAGSVSCRHRCTPLGVARRCHLGFAGAADLADVPGQGRTSVRRSRHLAQRTDVIWSCERPRPHPLTRHPSRTRRPTFSTDSRHVVTHAAQDVGKTARHACLHALQGPWNVRQAAGLRDLRGSHPGEDD